MKKMIENIAKVPTLVFVVITAVLNYTVGVKTAEINQMFSEITSFEKSDFFNKVICLVIAWAVMFMTNSFVGKIMNMKLLNYNYMKWIEKLTRSKISSITSVGTGGLSGAIHTISQCDKEMFQTTLRILPMISPIIVMSKNEYCVAGVAPVAINIAYITIVVVASLLIAKMKYNKIAAAAGAKMRSVTTDCIMNSKTVKYFNKEDWSIEKQRLTQNETFVESLNLPKYIGLRFVYGILQYIPTLINSYLCWSSPATILFVSMTDYCLINTADLITSFIDCYADKKANLELLGSLEPDKIEKKPIESLVVKDVVFKYTSEAKVVFKINDVTIKRGHRYCITGKSGFGKSTFIKLLTKTVVPDASSGQIDSVDTIYMFAESEMFNASVLDNIALGDDTVTLNEIKDILSNLEVVLDMDLEKDPVGEKGELLSTGQRQRINLARVIVYARRHPGVLVALDEVTSALDEVTSINCINYLCSEFERLGTTLLYVSNKSDYKDTNLITDNIYVERNGDVVTYVQQK